ncbi:MAG: alkaline phosphatase family protein [Deltaproteobacteria bacterium]|nr:alkaline phosphatase family protein [Deltaproteobacteria bacterium]
MKRWFINFFLLFFLPSLVFASPKGDSPKRVMVVVLDQMRPDYIETYNLTNLKKLRDNSLSFKNANVGHFPTNTVMSHPVIGTGLFPKHYGWSDELYEDREGWFGPKGERSITADFGLKQFRKIYQKNLPRPTALSLLKEKLGGEVIAIGQKDYAAITMGGLDADRVIVPSGKIKKGKWKGWRRPDGLNVPSYIAKPVGGRFWLDCRDDYGTKGSLYPLDGNRYVPGEDPEHWGGDFWTTDVALAVIEKNPEWRVLLVTLGGVDKIGHLFGEMDNPAQQKATADFPYNFRRVLKIADEQVGRLVADLKKRGLWEKTIFIVTADHGGLSSAKHFYGERQRPGHDGHDNFYYGPFQRSRDYKPSVLARKWLDGRVENALLSTANRIWLNEEAKRDVPAQCRHFSQMPAAIAVYRKNGEGDSYFYERCSPYRGPHLPPFLDPVTLLNTSASGQAPDLVVQLADDSGYALLGDHGGFQEKSMRIPFFLHTPGIQPAMSHCPIRLVDLLPIVMTQVGVKPPSWMDGNTDCLKP